MKVIRIIKTIKKHYIELNIYYKLLPYLFLYLMICLIFNNNALVGDEVRYFKFASNILNGAISQEYAHINLSCGPGYPLLLAPFIFLKFPFILLKMFNVLFLYFSLILSYKTFLIYSTQRNSLLFTILIGLYFSIFRYLPTLLAECLTWFLISLISFLLLKNFENKEISWKYLILASVAIAYLAMTKIIFGYVIIFMLIISLIMFLWSKYRSTAKKSVLIFSFAFILCLPWLFYTYSITNIPFLWAWSGSNSLYTISSLDPEESGDWLDDSTLVSNPYHKDFMENVLELNTADMDKAYLRKGVENIVNHPLKYVYNYISNVGRILFSYPHSYRKQNLNPYFTIIPNMFVIVILLLVFPVGLVHYKRFPKGIVLLFLFVFIYLLGSSMVSATARMFYITIPFWFLLISFIFSNIITIRIKE